MRLKLFQQEILIKENLIWKDFSEQITKERVIKSDSEVKKIEEAISISDRAFNTVSKKIKEGMTEEEIAWEMEKDWLH